MNHGYTYRDAIGAAHAGMTVLDYYDSRYKDFSISEWQSRIAQGQIFLDGERAEPSALLKAGSMLEYRRPPWEEPEVPMEIPILFDDADLMVFNKPSGLPVLPGGGYLEHTMLHIVRVRHGSSLAPIHRLGRGTSGAILFTKTQAAAATLSNAMRERRLDKTYLALAQGCIKEDTIDVDAPIGPIPHPLLGRVYAASASGKASLSRVTILERREASDSTLVQVHIPTGRPHQIRIHLAYAGYPLLGDPLYSAGGVFILPDNPSDTAVPGDCGYTLHSWRLCFPHPSTGEFVGVTAPPPEILQPRL